MRQEDKLLAGFHTGYFVGGQTFLGTTKLTCCILSYNDIGKSVGNAPRHSLTNNCPEIESGGKNSGCGEGRRSQPPSV